MGEARNTRQCPSATDNRHQANSYPLSFLSPCQPNEGANNVREKQAEPTVTLEDRALPVALIFHLHHESDVEVRN